MYKFENGEVHLPDLPGLGLDVDEDAVEKYRVRQDPQ
jgi:L-alanine-DL-glutamate epimerase-like enolase superfamily enzyme